MRKKKILIVDDDPDVRLSLHKRLQAHEYDTYEASDGVTCMSEARKVQPDLILLDLGLPAGDGFESMKRLHNIPTLSTIPVIIISGRDRRSHQKEAAALGARAFLEKPVNNAVLLQAIRSVLGEQSRTEEPAVYNLVDPYQETPPEPVRQAVTRRS
jgi:DNA-binding response OmpR family regulator